MLGHQKWKGKLDENINVNKCCRFGHTFTQILYLCIHCSCPMKVLLKEAVVGLERKAWVAPQWSPVPYTFTKMLQQVHIVCACCFSYIPKSLASPHQTIYNTEHYMTYHREVITSDKSEVDTSLPSAKTGVILIGQVGCAWPLLGERNGWSMVLEGVLPRLGEKGRGPTTNIQKL